MRKLSGCDKWPTGVFPFSVDSFIQNVLSLKQCVQISNRFHRWIPRVEIFKTRSHIDRFWQSFFHEKNRTKNGSTGFFLFRKRHARASHEMTTVPLMKAKPWLSWKEKKQKMHFFHFRVAWPWLSRKQKHASRGNKTVTLVKEEKMHFHGFFSKIFFWPKS